MILVNGHCNHASYHTYPMNGPFHPISPLFTHFHPIHPFHPISPLSPHFTTFHPLHPISPLSPHFIPFHPFPSIFTPFTPFYHFHYYTPPLGNLCLNEESLCAYESDFYSTVAEASTPGHKHDTIQDKDGGVLWCVEVLSWHEIWRMYSV